MPLGLSSEPMKSLKGPLYTEMVHLHKQKNRKKHGYVNRNNKNKETVSRHTKLKNQTSKGRRSGIKNEDLLFGPVDELMREMYPDEKLFDDEQKSDKDS